MRTFLTIVQHFVQKLHNIYNEQPSVDNLGSFLPDEQNRKNKI